MSLAAGQRVLYQLLANCKYLLDVTVVWSFLCELVWMKNASKEIGQGDTQWGGTNAGTTERNPTTSKNARLRVEREKVGAQLIVSVIEIFQFITYACSV